MDVGPLFSQKLERKYWCEIRSLAARYRTLLLGIVIAVGSTGLVLGGVTVAVTGLFVALGLSLIEALVLGFAVVGGGGVLVGGLLVYFGVPRRC